MWRPGSANSDRTFGARTHVATAPLSRWIALGAFGAIGLVAGCSGSGPGRAPRPLAPLSGAVAIREHEEAHTRVTPSAHVSAELRRTADTATMPKGGGVYKLGSPYKVAGRWYVPTEDRHYDRRGMASWYGADFHGRKTANGETFDMHALTAAHPTLPLPSYAYVTSLSTNRKVLVRINDRGPYANDRIMDLSRRTSEVLGIAGAGVSEVRVTFAGRAPLNGDDSAERRFLASQPWAGASIAGSEQTGSMGRMGLLR